MAKYKCNNCGREHQDTDGSNDGADCGACIDGVLRVVEEEQE